jgi:hypothetical protein
VTEPDDDDAIAPTLEADRTRRFATRDEREHDDGRNLPSHLAISSEPRQHLGSI